MHTESLCLSIFVRWMHAKAKAKANENLSRERDWLAGSSKRCVQKPQNKIKIKTQINGNSSAQPALSHRMEKNLFVVLCCTFGVHSCISLNYVSQTHDGGGGGGGNGKREAPDTQVMGYELYALQFHYNVIYRFH